MRFHDPKYFNDFCAHFWHLFSVVGIFYHYALIGNVHRVTTPLVFGNLSFKSSCYSAGKRDRGKKQKTKQGPPCQGQGGAEGPDAGSFYGGGGRRPPTTRANTGAPRKKSFQQKLKNCQRYYTRLCKTQNSAI